jgi:predicted RNA-binding Zn-ribbon protein involved in translation (DUF1610 family)
MSADRIRAKKDRRQNPDRRVTTRSGRRVDDADPTANRLLCPHCGKESVTAFSEGGYRRYGCQDCGKKW